MDEELTKYKRTCKKPNYQFECTSETTYADPADPFILFGLCYSSFIQSINYTHVNCCHSAIPDKRNEQKEYLCKIVT